MPTTVSNSIYNTLHADERLNDMMRKAETITIVEHCAYNIRGSVTLYTYLNTSGIGAFKVKKVVALGAYTEQKKICIEKLAGIFGSAQITQVSRNCKQLNTDKIFFTSPLVIHFIPDSCIDGTGLTFANIRHFAGLTQSLNSTLIVYGDITGHVKQIFYQSTRLDTALPKPKPDAELTAYCRQKKEYMELCAATLAPQSILRELLSEARNGCQQCPLAPNYGHAKLCPMAQHAIAKFIRENDNSNISPAKAHQWEKFAAAQGYKPAEIQVADDQTSASGCDKDAESALATFRKYAQQGDEQCAQKLIDAAEKGDEIPNSAALQWICALAHAGNAVMAEKLAEAYRSGTHGLTPDLDKSAEWEEIAAENSDPEKMEQLLTMCIESKLWDRALFWHRKIRTFPDSSIEKEHLHDAAVTIICGKYKALEEIANAGEKFLYGFGEVKDPELAEMCLTYAAEKDNVKAQAMLCNANFYGNFGKQDYQKSYYWGEKALANGDRSVRFNVAYSANTIGKYDTAFNLYSELAEENNSAAINNLGVMYERGRHVTTDKHKAFELYLKAAEMRDEVASKNVAVYYEYGTGVEKDLAKALEWYIKSAQWGNVRSMMKVAEFYRQGNGCEKNAEQMIYWYEKAGNAGNSDAWNEIGLCYERGVEIPQDYEKALKFYLMAAEKGNATGQYKTGFMFHYGKGVDADIKKAIYWYRKAAQQGNIFAKTKLTELDADWIKEQAAQQVNPFEKMKLALLRKALSET